jgi:hypothetical protein
MARLEEQKLTSLGGMKQAAMGQARGELLSPIMGQEFGYNQLGEQGRIANMGDATQRYGIQQQTGLGYAGLASNERLAGNQLGFNYAQLGQDANQFGQTMNYNLSGRDWQAGQNQLDRQHQTAENKASRPGTFDKVLGFASGVLSDIRVKENIREESPALSALLSIPTYSYNYTFEPGVRRMGVMAQDVEQVAPNLVHDGPDGLKRVDQYGLLTLTMAAVKELGNDN